MNKMYTKGEWIPQDHNSRNGHVSTCVYYYPKCSVCGHVGNYEYNFCPHCGEKMGEVDGETSLMEMTVNELWNMITDVVNMDECDLEDAFNREYIGDVLLDYDLDDFIAMYRQYKEEEKKIHIGDEVEWTVGTHQDGTPYKKTGIILGSYGTYHSVLVFESKFGYPYESVVQNDLGSLHKTGRKFYRIRDMGKKLAK